MPSARSRSSVSWPFGGDRQRAGPGVLRIGVRAARSRALRARRPAWSAWTARCPRPPPGRRAAAALTRSTVDRAASCVGVSPASSCLRSRRDSRAMATRSRVTSITPPQCPSRSRRRPTGLSWFPGAMHEDYAVRRGPRIPGANTPEQAGQRRDHGAECLLLDHRAVEVASRGRAVSEITRAVEHAGGVVTALDVTSGVGNEEWLRGGRHLRRRRDTAHAEAIVAALAAIDGRDRPQGQRPTFLLHLGRQDRDRPRCRCATAMTCPWPTSRASAGRRLAHRRKTPTTWRLLDSPSDNSVAVGDRRLSCAPEWENRPSEAAMRLMEGKAALFKRVGGHRRVADLPGDRGDRRDSRLERRRSSCLGSAASTWRTSPRRRCFEVERSAARTRLEIWFFDDDEALDRASACSPR